MDKEDMKEKRTILDRFKSLSRSKVGIGLIAVASAFGMGEKTTEAASQPLLPKADRQMITSIQDNDFDNRINLSSKKEVRFKLNEDRKPVRVQVRCATPEENAKLSEMQTRQRDLYRQRANTKDKAEIEEINKQLNELVREKDKILIPIRERQQQRPEREYEGR